MSVCDDLCGRNVHFQPLDTLAVCSADGPELRLAQDLHALLNFLLELEHVSDWVSWSGVSAECGALWEFCRRPQQALHLWTQMH